MIMRTRFIDMAKRFFQLEAAGGIILVAFAAFAMVLANSSLGSLYSDIFGSHEAVVFINDGLMAIFFLLVGLEIKREILRGELSSKDRAFLPFVAALGGMAVPALIYYIVNRGHPDTSAGWAIPSATDIAFSLGVLALLGSRVPSSLKVLLLAIAVIDDLGAIIIIALFYASSLSFLHLGIGLALMAVLALLNWRGCSNILPYIVVGAGLWLALFYSGIHATIAGVVTALAIPLSAKNNPDFSPVETVEHYLHPWVAFGILPLFAFANAGVPFAGMDASVIFEPVTMGIGAGLFFGKVIGIFGALFLMIRSGLCPMPKEASWVHMWGIAHLCGIGFTMSLFIGELALHGGLYQAEIRLGVLGGSILSAIVAYVILKLSTRPA